jgi:hypothetical protein
MDTSDSAKKKIFKFIEPSIGIPIQVDLWYIVSDAGSCYSSLGFASLEAAKEWWEAHGSEYECDLEVPTWDAKTNSWPEGFEGANAVLGQNLLDFWQTEDPECLDQYSIQYQP